MAAERQELIRWQIQTYASKLTYIPKSGELVYFNSVITGQLSPVAVIGDGTSQVNALPFMDKLEISITNNLDIQALRISGNRLKIYNSGSITVEIEIGVTASSRTFYLLAGKSVDLFFNGSVWMHESENIITMTEADLTLDDISGPTKVIMPLSGITANRTVTLPTLADNQNQQIKFENRNSSYQLIIDGEGAETIETDFTEINLSTEYTVLEGTSSTWKRISYSSIRPKFQIEDRRAYNTQSGAATTGAWTKRLINEEIIADVIGASLNEETYQFTLPAGKYRICGRAQFYAVDENKIRIYNITDDAEEIRGLNNFARFGTGNDNVGASCEIDGEASVLDTKTFELQYYCKSNYTADGLGVRSTDDSAQGYEKYVSVIFEKLI